MLLNYVFEVVGGSVPHDAGTHISNQWFEPHYHKEDFEVDFEYEITPTLDDYFRYVAREMETVTAETYKRDKLLFGELIKLGFIDTDLIEEETEFIDEMLDKYRDKAKDACDDRYI